MVVLAPLPGSKVAIQAASDRITLPPPGMTQVSHAVRDLGAGSDLVGGHLVLSARTAGGSFAAYASAIDNVANDPRTLLPR